jgi:ribosomal protein S17E
MANIGQTYIKRIFKEPNNIYLDKFVASDFQYNAENVLELDDFDSNILQNRVAW